MNRKRAFSLPEVLVVIGLIGLLIAMLIPVTVRSRESARSLVCKNNLRQIHEAFMRYADDNKQFFPAPLPTMSGGWAPWYEVIAFWILPKEKLWPTPIDEHGMARQICNVNDAPFMFCPTLLLAGWSLQNGTTYTMAECARAHDQFSPPEDPPRYGYAGYPRWDHARDPSRKVYMMDWQGGGPVNEEGDLVAVPFGSNWNSKPSLPHLGTSNYLFFDGHVESLRPDELTPLMWKSED